MNIGFVKATRSSTASVGPESFPLALTFTNNARKPKAYTRWYRIERRDHNGVVIRCSNGDLLGIGHDEYERRMSQESRRRRVARASGGKWDASFTPYRRGSR